MGTVGQNDSIPATSLHSRPNSPAVHMRRPCLATTLLVVHGVAGAPKLHDAAGQNNEHTIQAFLDAGADLNLRDPATGQTPLMFSVLNGFTASVRYLLSAGADTSIGENDGYTPLHGAAFQGRAEIAKILIDHGLDPNELHTDGYTVSAPARGLAESQPPSVHRLCRAARSRCIAHAGGESSGTRTRSPCCWRRACHPTRRRMGSSASR